MKNWKQKVKDWKDSAIDYLRIAFFMKPPYMINNNRLYYFLDSIRVLFGGWKRDLIMCPSQIEKKVKNIYGEECTLYLRWRWEDPWSFSILKETRNAEGGGKIDFLADELFYRHKIGLSHDEYQHAERIAMTLWSEIYRYYKLEELPIVSKTHTSSSFKKTNDSSVVSGFVPNNNISFLTSEEEDYLSLFHPEKLFELRKNPNTRFHSDLTKTPKTGIKKAKKKAVKRKPRKPS
jgi:hypothetical protein